jgi:hypothetical protein
LVFVGGRGFIEELKEPCVERFGETDRLIGFDGLLVGEGGGFFDIKLARGLRRGGRILIYFDGKVITAKEMGTWTHALATSRALVRLKIQQPAQRIGG